MKRTILLDGDWILYTAGFAGESKRYVCPAIYGSQEFNTLKLLKDEDPEAPYQLEHIYHRVEVSPVEWVLHTSKNMIANAVAKIEKKCGDECHLVVMLDGQGNFRHDIATIRPYKGNRHTAKPVHYNAIRDYLIDNYHVELVDGEEVDDRMAITASSHPASYVMCAIDKDMLQVPGYHYNPNKGFRKVSKKQGELFLYRQALTGDSTDNIAGALNVGEKKARELLTPDMTEEQKWRVIVGVYESTLDQYGGDIYGGLTGREAALENMRLVYLRRKPGELWVPPDRRTGG